MYATRSAQDTARDAVQIFGGRGITKSGMGRFIEHVRAFYFCVDAAGVGADMSEQYYRTVTFDALLGGGKLLPVLTRGDDLMAHKTNSGGRAG